MKKTGILNSSLSAVIASMGHGDMLVVCDSGLPIPQGVRRIDLALRCGLPSLLDTLQEVNKELQVEKLTYASEAKPGCGQLIEQINELFGEPEVNFVTHDELKTLTHRAIAIVRTGECTPYANVILHAGVTF